MAVPIGIFTGMTFFKYININKLNWFRLVWKAAGHPNLRGVLSYRFCQNGIHDSRIVLLLLTGILAMGTRTLAADDPDLTVGTITFDSRSIFSQGEIDHTNGALRLMRKTMNGLHVNTRQYVIRRELLFKEGQPYNPDRLAETERNLRALGYLNNIRVTAVDTTSDGRVNIRVSTRETWTLQTSFSFSIASGDNQRWSLQLSDRNFLGQGVELGGGVGENEITSYWNLWFRQQRLFGTGLRLGLDYADREDGYLRQVQLGKPFYALDDTWALELDLWDNLGNVRYYLSNAGPAGDDPSRAASLYAELPFHDSAVVGAIQKRVSRNNEGRIWRLGGGLRIRKTLFDLDQSAYELSDGRAANLDWLDEPGQPFAREQGTTVFPFVWVHSLGRTWTTARFVLEYGPIEDIPMDLEFEIKAGPAGGTLGSTTGYAQSKFHAEAHLNKWYRAAGGFLFVEGVGEGDAGGSEVRNYLYDVTGGWVGTTGAEMTPWITRVFAEYGQGRNLLGSRALRLGLDRGLRTLEYDGMAGDRLARWNIEQGKAMPWEIAGLFRVGIAGFYDGGRAWWRDETRGPDAVRQEAGFGLRFGPTRSGNSQIARLDLAWDLNGTGGPVITAVSRGYF